MLHAPGRHAGMRHACLLAGITCGAANMVLLPEALAEHLEMIHRDDTQAGSDMCKSCPGRSNVQVDTCVLVASETGCLRGGSVCACSLMEGWCTCNARSSSLVISARLVSRLICTRNISRFLAMKSFMFSFSCGRLVLAGAAAGAAAISLHSTYHIQRMTSLRWVHC